MSSAQTEAVRRGMDAQDYRSSVVRAHKRADASDFSLEICGWCGCEVDVVEPAHQPGCKGLGGPVMQSESGPIVRSALGEPGGDASAAAPQPGSPSVGAVLSEREPQAVPPVSEPTDPQPKAPSRSENTARRQGRPTRWTRESVGAAIQRFHREHGRPPTQADWVRSGLWWPSFSTAARVFEGWGAAVEAAGFDRPTKGRRAKTSDGPVVGDPAVTGSAFVPGDGDSVSAIPAVAPLPVRPGPSEALAAARALVELLERMACEG